MDIKIKMLLLFLASTLLFKGCKVSQQLHQKEKCKQMLREWLSDKWFYNPETNTYRETRETIAIQRPSTDRAPCWELMSRDDAIELLGEPSREDTVKNRMFYFYFDIDFDRFDSTSYCGHCMFVQLNDSGRVKHFYFAAF